MSHLSLYRKFRPDTFEKMVRQEHVVRILKNQIEKNAVGHAYLFTGPRGTGKTSVARIFARAVNCEHPVNGSPCGTCATCRALSEGSLDISEIDAASNNGVGEMRDLREKVQYPPVSGRYKVYIVDEVHMLTDSAFNALLKTLEEPPAHAIFILATTEPQKIPATILSRCMRLDFKLIPEEDLEKHLKSILDEIGKPYEEEAVAAIARAGAGSDRDMLSIAEACIVYADTLTYEAVNAVLGAADFHETCKLVRAMLTLDMPTAIHTAESILSEGKSVGVLLKDILNLLSQVTVAKTCKNAEQLLALPRELFKAVKEIADVADGRAILRATEILIKTESELRYVSSPRISLEAAIMRVSYPEADYNVDALLVRIQHLEDLLARTPMPLAAIPVPPVSNLPIEGKVSAKQTDEVDSYLFPDEEPVFQEAYFSDEPPKAATKPNPATRHPEPNEQVQPSATPVTRHPELNGQVQPSATPVTRHPEPNERSATPVTRHPERSAEREVEGSRNTKSAPQAPAPHTAPQAPAPHTEAQPSVSPSVGNAATPTDSPEIIFGRFMRTLRKTSKSGVLFTMCSDLIASYDGTTLVLATESETIQTALRREDHRKTMETVFTEIGVSAFEVRLRKKGAEEKKDALAELKKNFKDYPIEIK